MLYILKDYNRINKMNMKKIVQYSFIAIVYFAIVSCNQSSTPNVNIPEYKLLKTEEPKVKSNGYISPTQNLEYYIEIDHPFLQDSLELLQNYFVEKGISEFPGVNKVIVRVYLKGASIQGIPYASLILIGDKKEINITGSANSADFVNNQLVDYDVLGCWTVYGDGGYVLCKKAEKYFAVYIDKKNQKVGELELIKTKKVRGETAYYSPNPDNHEYMIIMSDGLYIYDETGESGTDPVVWPNDPSWNR